jgi:hypothetical protein
MKMVKLAYRKGRYSWKDLKEKSQYAAYKKNKNNIILFFLNF